MKITFADTDKTTFLVIEDDGNYMLISNPPGSDEDKKLIEDYGGLFEVERTWVETSREAQREEELFNKFMDFKDRFVESVTIDAIIEETLTQAEIMQIKMSIFKKDEVRQCKNTDLLTDLRKSEDIIDIIKYYGIIRDEVRAAT